jgi:LuxR family maltose regulon positive regulatory protein
VTDVPPHEAPVSERPGDGGRPPTFLRPPGHRSGFVLEPPEVPTWAVQRERLLSLLDVAVQQRLTVVVAPPGYGKTVLLSQWATRHPPWRVRWLTLTPELNDDIRFVDDLRRALERRTTRRQRRTHASAREVPGSAMGQFAVLLDVLDDMPPTVLVLDDFQALTDPSLLDDLGALLEEAPKLLHVVISSRVNPQHAYYRLRLSDALVELRQDDLALTHEEAAELIRRVSGRQLSKAQIAALVARTEGWAVGLQLAGVSLRQKADPDAFVESFIADDRHIADYLTEEVLHRQPPPIRSFLLMTSVLERMSGPLCDFVTRRSDSQAMLEELDRMSMFIVRLDPRRYWFRYHPLFRALLLHHLHDENPDLEHAVLRRAANWHLTRGELAEAVTYFAQEGDFDAVLEASVEYGGDMLAQGHPTTVARWIESVPQETRIRRVDALLLHAAALIVGEEPTARGAEALGEVDDHGDAEPGIRIVADLLRSYLALRQSAPGEAITAGRRVLDATNDNPGVVLPNVLGLTGSREDVLAGANTAIGMALLQQGHLDAARARLESAIDEGHFFTQVRALGALSLVEAWSGRLRVADQLAARAIALARHLGLDHGPIIADACLTLAHVALRRDQEDRARELLDKTEMHAKRIRSRLVSVSVANERALLALAGNQPAAGFTILAARRARMQTSMPSTLIATRRAIEAQLYCALGDFENAAQALELAPVETCEIAAARLQLAVERGDLQTAREVLARWPDGPTPRAQRERLMWDAVLAHLEGDEARAQATFAAVVAEAEAEHDVGMFTTSGRLLLRPARALYRIMPTAFLRSIIERPQASGAGRPANDLLEQITEREHMVLSLLPTRLSNVEIANQLDISLNTVKTHLKHIYRKLGVARRREAVGVAERLNML